MLKQMDVFLGQGYYLDLFQPPGGGGVSSWITGLKEISMILTGLKVVVFFCKENFRRRRIFSKKKTRKSSISYLKMCLLSIKTFFFSPAALIFNWT